MLTVLAISNYRSLRNLVVPLRQLNVVTGANGSGKSSLYCAVRLLADTAQGRVIPSLAREGVRTDQNAEAIKQEYQSAVGSIKQYLASLSGSASQFNGQLESLVTSQLKTRKDRLLADAGMTAAIGLPLKKREGLPLTYSVPVTRRPPKIEQLNVGGAFKPEPALANEDYEEILRIMQNMVQVMELSPHAFNDVGEEDLRFQFLVQLNGAFKGRRNTARTHLALKTKATLARVRPAGTLPWLGFDRVQTNTWFSRGSIVESMHWMVLHRPVELAALIGN